MAHARKTRKKNKVVPCTDANQHVREHIALVNARAKREMELRERRMAEMKAQYEAAQQARMSTATAQALGNNNEVVDTANE